MTRLGGERIWHWSTAAMLAAVLSLVALLALSIGAVPIPFSAIVHSALHMRNGLTGLEQVLLWDLRLPRVMLAALVGAALATSGAVYQTVFRNPLADPYLLGTAAGAGLGATIAMAGGTAGFHAYLPLFAFVGGVTAVLATFAFAGGIVADPRSLLLAGIAVGSFATAIQTYLQQRNSAVLRPVYSWILGELTSANWDTVRWAGLYIALAIVGMVTVSRRLDALMLSDDEAHSLGIRPQRLRIFAVACATLATATAVSASGLIGFVGIVVPHLVRGMTKRATNRALLSIALAGASFLTLADLGSRVLLAPAELPIGVLTAMVGAPFFAIVMRMRTRAS
jgi:iron complex transport system permease protein